MHIVKAMGSSSSFRGLILCAVVAVAVAMAAGQTAWASVLPFSSIEALTEKAEVVFRGRVQDVEYRLVDEGRRVVTLLIVSVEDGFKGRDSGDVKVIVPGGRYGELVQRVAGMPTFYLDEEVVLFLERYPAPRASTAAERFTLVSMGLGAFLVEGDKALRRADELRVVRERPGSPEPLGEKDRRMSIAVLEDRIRAAIVMDE